MPNWTIRGVIEHLPDITVRLPDGRILPGIITGRKEDCPRVHVALDGGLDLNFKASWATIVHCLNVNKPMIY